MLQMKGQAARDAAFAEVVLQQIAVVTLKDLQRLLNAPFDLAMFHLRHPSQSAQRALGSGGEHAVHLVR